MRIITGIYKGRHFDIPRSFKARPTTDFAKENIFNVLNGYIDLDGAMALDLFAGTGSISLEMLSRGCSQVVSANVLIRGDVFRFIKSCCQQFDFIFADPPYALDNIDTIPDLIFEHNLLKPDGILVVEHGKANNFVCHPRYLEHRVYGSVNFSIFR